jgi:hypothetical protein
MLYVKSKIDSEFKAIRAGMTSEFRAVRAEMGLIKDVGPCS